MLRGWSIDKNVKVKFELSFMKAIEGWVKNSGERERTGRQGMVRKTFSKSLSSVCGSYRTYHINLMPPCLSENKKAVDPPSEVQRSNHSN